MLVEEKHRGHTCWFEKEE